MNINLYLLIKFNYHCTDDTLSSFLLAYPLTWNLYICNAGVEYGQCS